jgi:hypothetical protein
MLRIRLGRRLNIGSCMYMTRMPRVKAGKELENGEILRRSQCGAAKFECICKPRVNSQMKDTPFDHEIFFCLSTFRFASELLGLTL